MLQSVNKQEIRIPLARMDYDDLTLQVRDTLFRSAQYLNDDELETLEKACAYGFWAHQGVSRSSGEPYITHPLTVTSYLANWRMDIDVLCAGILHDVIEDVAGIDKETISHKFNSKVGEMVEGLSKFPKDEFDDYKKHKTASMEKLVLALGQDIRIIVVKLADRLHNMRTLAGVRPDKRLRAAKETSEFYVPMAYAIGFNQVYRQLQDLCFEIEHPKRYRILSRAMATFRQKNGNIIEKISHDFKTFLAQYGLTAQVFGLEKNIYSVHQLVKMHGKFDNVPNLYNFRIILDSNDFLDCYKATGILHNSGEYRYRPGGNMKDYIGIPKDNGYRSFHTTLTSRYGVPLEVQICTKEMFDIAEMGASDEFDRDKMVHILRLQKKIANLQNQKITSEEFIENLTRDLNEQEMYVVSPEGDLITLPREATILDFAYKIHTELGNHAVKGRVNNGKSDGKILPLNAPLKNGDMVHVYKSPEAHPHPEWLEWVKTGQSRSCIRSALRALDKDLKLEMAKEYLGRHLPKDWDWTQGDHTELLGRVGNGEIRIDEALKLLNH